MDWPEGKNFGMSPEKHAERAPLHNKLPESEKHYAFFTDGSCLLVGKYWRWKAVVFGSPLQVTGSAEEEGELSETRPAGLRHC